MHPGLIVLMLHFVFASIAGSARIETLTFTHRERSLQPGEVILLEARSLVPLKQLRIKAFAAEFPAFAEDGGLRWKGLAGIDLDTKPGSYSLELHGVDMHGNNVMAGETLEVKARQFPTRRLTVDEKYVTPPAKVLARIKEERERVNRIFASTSPDRFWRGHFLRPVPGSVISAFGKRSIYNGKPRSPHGGVDFRGASGTPVKAPNAGSVVLAANLYYSGNTVILDHGLGLYSYFGHMSAISVMEGDRVETGNIVGQVGATGVVTGPHLHWTVRLLRTRVDPLSLVEITGSDRSKLKP